MQLANREVMKRRTASKKNWGLSEERENQKVRSCGEEESAVHPGEKQLKGETKTKISVRKRTPGQGKRGRSPPFSIRISEV